MKKLLAVALTCAMTATIFSGCGKTDSIATNASNASEAGDFYKYENISDIVKLGAYEGLDIEVDPIEDVTDETITYYIQSLLAQSAYVKDETKTVVEADSIVNLNYKGTLNGVAFDRGSATNQIVDIAANRSVSGSSYIPGFTSGLEGTKVGETVAYEVTFPDNYQSEELAGKTATFSFDINYVCKNPAYDELDDASVNELFGVASLTELRSQVKSQLESTMQSNYTESVRKAIESKVVEDATVEIPDDLVYARVDAVCKSYEEYYGITMDEFSWMYAGVSYEEFAVTLGTQARKALASELTFRAVAEDAGLKFNDKEYESFVQGMMSAYGLESTDALYTMLKPSEKESGEEFAKNTYLCTKALEYCTDKANIKAKESKAN